MSEWHCHHLLIIGGDTFLGFSKAPLTALRDVVGPSGWVLMQDATCVSHISLDPCRTQRCQDILVLSHSAAALQAEAEGDVPGFAGAGQLARGANSAGLPGHGPPARPCILPPHQSRGGGQEGCAHTTIPKLE